MMMAMLIAGVGLVLAGLLAIGVGIPNKEFSVGGTLILTGVIGVCTGAIMLGLWMAVRELKTIARRLGSGAGDARGEAAVRPALPPGIAREPAPADGGLLFTRDQPPRDNAGSTEPSSPPPWYEQARHEQARPRGDAPPEAAPPAEAATPAKPKRNLLFSSSSRKERERAQTRTSEPLPPDLLSPELRPNPPAAPLPLEPDEAQPPSFEDAWPKSERSRPGEIPPQRRPRKPSTFNETNGTAAEDRPPPAPRNEDQPPVTVLKSGVVDGMAYSLYSDGSIEAQMPEGMMRFASIDELRTHLDQRP
jgi:hypothetical protein